MNKKTLRLLSFLMCIAVFAASFASCKSSDDKKKKTDKKEDSTSNVTESTESVDQITDTGDIDDPLFGNDGDFNYGYGGDYSDSVTVERPQTSGLISSGIKKAFEEGSTEDDPNLEGDGSSDDNFEIGDDIDENENNYTALIQKVGKAVSGKTRKINVQNSTAGIVFTDFDGISTNVFPTQSTLFSQATEGTAEAYLDMNGKRFNDTAPRYARSWFQVDWIITNEAGDDYKKYVDDWDSNPDYRNYYNDIFCFSKGQTLTDELNSAIDYYKMLEEANVEIYLAFGWKVGTRVQDWFGNEPLRTNIAAPRDLEQYADAAAALFKYMRNEVGLTNFNILSFYNEPDTSDSYTYRGSWDYVTIGDKCIYWAEMARECHKEFDKHSDLKDVLIMGPDSSRRLSDISDTLVNAYLRKYADDSVDAYTLHFYGYSNDDHEELYYEDFFDETVFAYNWYGPKPVFITEYYTADVDIDDLDYAWQDEVGWSASETSFFIAIANTGIKGGFSWGFTGGRLIDPTSFMVADADTARWMHPRGIESINEVHLSFYQDALLNQYVTRGSNVHNITWTGDDIRCAAFTSKNGKDFSLVVEANEKSVDKTLDINLEKSLGGKDVYLYWFNHNWTCDGNALIPQCQDVIKNVNRSISYDINGNYGVYVFTTIKPVKQVALFDEQGEVAAAVRCEKGKEITIKSELVDCGYDNINDQVEWEITRYSAAPKYTAKGEELKREDCIETGTYTSKGKLTDNGDGTMTYEATADADTDDVIAVRCTIKDGDKNRANDRYAVCMIIIR